MGPGAATGRGAHRHPDTDDASGRSVHGTMFIFGTLLLKLSQKGTDDALSGV
jgi:hypothetical protein